MNVQLYIEDADGDDAWSGPVRLFISVYFFFAKELTTEPLCRSRSAQAMTSLASPQSSPRMSKSRLRPLQWRPLPPHPPWLLAQRKRTCRSSISLITDIAPLALLLVHPSPTPQETPRLTATPFPLPLVPRMLARTPSPLTTAPSPSARLARPLWRSAHSLPRLSSPSNDTHVDVWLNDPHTW